MKVINTIVPVFLAVYSHGQILNFQKEFSWPEVETHNPELVQQFLDQHVSSFSYYRQSSLHTSKINDLINALHLVDLNGDGLDDIVFDGWSGGEPKMISIYINEGDSFKKVFSELQGILKMEFADKCLSKLVIHDWGCCAATQETVKFFQVKVANNNWIFSLSHSLVYINLTDLPKTYLEKSKTIEVINSHYNVRSSPEIDDTTEYYDFGEIKKGNVVGKMSQGDRAIAMAESMDSTGRTWYFVAIPPTYELNDSHFFDYPDEPKSYKCGWISSRYVNTIK